LCPSLSWVPHCRGLQMAPPDVVEMDVLHVEHEGLVLLIREAVSNPHVHPKQHQQRRLHERGCCPDCAGQEKQDLQHTAPAMQPLFRQVVCQLRVQKKTAPAASPPRTRVLSRSCYKRIVEIRTNRTGGVASTNKCADPTMLQIRL
jgi:hypothetical protein